MQARRVGQSGLWVSHYALGTNTWGGETDVHEARDLLTTYLDAGGTFLDTAISYTGGGSESVIGALLGDVVPRDQLQIGTKAGVEMRDGQRSVNTGRGALLRQLDDSLQRLDTDYVDLWQVHTPSDTASIDETMSALDAAVRSGRARYVGVSNYNGWQTARAASWHEFHGVFHGAGAFVSTQVEYSLLNRWIEREVLGAAEAFGLGVFAWSPLGRGILTGKYRAGIPADSRAAHARMSAFVDPLMTEQSNSIVEAVVKAADGLGWQPLQVALTWVRDRPGIAIPILGARIAAQLEPQLATVDLVLPTEIADALTDVSAFTTTFNRI